MLNARRGRGVPALRQRREGGFTLLELLVVVAIIGILAAFLAVFVGGLTRKAKIEKTRALLNRLSTGLQSYKEQFLAYPPSAQPFNDGARNLHWYMVAPQVRRTAIDPVTGVGTFVQVGPFVQNLSNGEVRNGNANPWGAPPYNNALASQVIDAWGTAFGYYCAQQGNVYGGTNHFQAGPHPDWLDNRGSFDLWSPGPNRQGQDPLPGPPNNTVGANEEITNWSPSR